jgi:hypothetical protein
MQRFFRNLQALQGVRRMGWLAGQWAEAEGEVEADVEVRWYKELRTRWVFNSCCSFSCLKMPLLHGKVLGEGRGGAGV